MQSVLLYVLLLSKLCSSVFTGFACAFDKHQSAVCAHDKGCMLRMQAALTQFFSCNSYWCSVFHALKVSEVGTVSLKQSVACLCGHVGRGLMFRSVLLASDASCK